ncbi:MAG: cell wall hydrolase [Bacilli bacterium]|nr:cell wall hydrolase [Bacilli bacterium]
MKKIVSNVLIVSTQLIVGGLFLFMLFSDSNEDNRVVVVENNNLDKMADAVSELFVVDHAVVVDIDKQKEEELVAAEEKKRLEEAAAAKAAAEAEAAAKAAAEAEAQRKAQEEAAARAAAEAEAARNQVVVDATGYISKPAAGFNVTTGNKTYVLDDSQFAILAKVVSCEANKSSKDDVLAVMSVILNRADRNGIDPVSVVAAPYQFSCYTGEGITPSATVASVMRDALNGVRNNNYYGFRSWYSSGYSSNYIIEGGNRYA